MIEYEKFDVVRSMSKYGKCHTRMYIDGLTSWAWEFRWFYTWRLFKEKLISNIPVGHGASARCLYR